MERSSLALLAILLGPALACRPTTGDAEAPEDAAGENGQPPTRPAVFIEREVADEPEVEVEVRGEMVRVPRGDFTRGTAEAEVPGLVELCARSKDDCQQAWFENETPQVSVYVAEFWIDRLEVSNAEYARCVAAGACRVRRIEQCERYDDATMDWSVVADPQAFLEPRQPVVCVSRAEAEGYCEWRGARLPSRSEWEKAARGTDARRFPWGNELPTCAHATFDEASLGSGCGKGAPAVVGSHPGATSPYGALDMSGNVAEWVRPDVGPDGTYEAEVDEIRGGHWDTAVVNLRTSERGFFTGMPPNVYAGFRCAADQPPAEP